MTTLEASIKQVSADPDFAALPEPQKVEYLSNAVLPPLDPDFSSLPQSKKEEYVRSVILPKVQPSNVGIERFIDRSKPLDTKVPQSVGTPGGFAPTTTEGLIGFQAGQAFGTGQAIKGATLGYVDPVTKVHEAYPDQNLTELTKSPISQIPEFAGSALPIMGIGAALEGLAPLNPLTARVFGTTAEAAGQNIPLLSRMARGAAELGGYEFLKSQPQNQFDLGKRIIEGAGGALAGAALPAAFAGGGKVLEAGAKFTRNLADEAANIFKPNEQAINLISQGVKRETAKALKYLDSVWTKLQRGEIDPKLVTSEDYASLVTKMDELSQALKTGKAVNPKKAIQAGARIERKAQIRSRVQKRPIESAENVQKREVKQAERQQSTEGPKENKQPESPAEQPKKEKIELKGSVKEQVKQVADDAGLPENAGESTAGQVEKQLGQKLTPDQKDIHTNLRAVARVEVTDESKGIFKQLPLSGRELKYSDVDQNISEGFQKDAQLIDDAMSQGKAVRVEYAAEEAGRSNEAAKVTGKGNVKVETTTFTPLYWGKTKEGKTLLHGYNQRGFFTTYHLEPSPQGSQILKARATDKAPFVGEYANVYLGPRPFLAKDVLGRGVRSEAGLIKTSEALTNAQDFATLFKSETIKQFNKTTQKILKQVQKRGRFDESTLKYVLKQIEKDKEELAKLCNLFGLPNAK